jgi:hypothetical protein
MIRAVLLLQLCYFSALGWAAGMRWVDETRDRAEMLVLLGMPVEQLSNLPI